jgi:uncharacterized protein (TIGR03435 family)
MGHFAEILGGYVHQPVLNATGLTGKYDFVISSPRSSCGSPGRCRRMPRQIQTPIVDHIERTPADN